MQLLLIISKYCQIIIILSTIIFIVFAFKTNRFTIAFDAFVFLFFFLLAIVFEWTTKLFFLTFHRLLPKKL